VSSREQDQMANHDAMVRAESRILTRLQEEAAAIEAEREWQRTGFIHCADCGMRVKTDNLASLPEHGCAERQARTA
jgi:hypothetical protein